MKTKQMQTEWKEVKLGEILDYEQPTNYIVTSDKYSDENETPVLTAGKSFVLGYTNEKDGVYNKLPVIIFDDFTTSSKFVTFPFKVKSSAMKILTPKTKDVNLKFIFLLMQTLKFDYTTHKRYYLSKYQHLKVHLPSLESQKKIVSILEKAEQLKEKRKKVIDFLDEYLKSVFNEMFLNKGFEEVELGKVCDLNPKKSEVSELNGDLEISFVPMEDVQEHKAYFNSNKSKNISEVYSGYTYFKENDILLAKVTPCFENGKSGIAVNLKNKIGFGSSEFHVLRPNKKILPQMIYYFISSQRFISGGKGQLTGTGGLRRLPRSYLENFKIPLPPLSLQQKFASIVEHVEKIKEKQKQSLEEIEQLNGVLMQRAFRGELVE